MKASVFIGVSVDGFIARPDGGLDWLPQGGGEPHGYDEFIASVVERMSGEPAEIVRRLDERGSGTHTSTGASPSSASCAPGSSSG